MAVTYAAMLAVAHGHNQTTSPGTPAPSPGGQPLRIVVFYPVRLSLFVTTKAALAVLLVHGHGHVHSRLLICDIRAS